MVGCLGTDGVCRDLKALLAKARSLEEEGISTYIYSGSYEIPVNTITNSCKSDLMLIDKIIGIGEVAISDHRSSQPIKMLTQMCNSIKNKPTKRQVYFLIFIILHLFIYLLENRVLVYHQKWF